MVNHAFFKALLFLSAGAVIHALQDEQDLRKYGGLLSLLPYCYILMLIGSFSLMALPFLTGFYSKEFILSSTYGHYSFSGAGAYWLSTVAAAFTAAYSIRSLYLTFLTKPNGPKVNYMGTHEPSLVMALPLFILAVFSLFFGFIGQEAFIGVGSGFFTNALFQHPNHVIEAEFSVPLAYKLFPLIATILSSSLLILFYTCFSHYGMWLKDLWRGLYVFFNQRYHFDSLYSFIGYKIIALGYITWKSLDKGVLELLGPFGLSKMVTSFSLRIASLDTGYIPHYAILILLGLIGFIYFVLSMPDPKGLILILGFTLILPYSPSLDDTQNSPLK